MVPLLLDECVSPRVSLRLVKEGIDSIHTRDRGLNRSPDHVIWRFANENGRAVVTMNARDFERLARGAKQHAGLMIIPSGFPPDDQYHFIQSGLRGAARSNDAAAGLVDTVVEVDENGVVVRLERKLDG